jgi:hypothetical protein
MREILSNTQKRRLEHIEYLYFHRTWVSFSTLITKLNCASRTLRSDIQEINSRLDYLTIETSEKKLRIIFDETHRLEAVHQLILNEAQGFKLVERVLLESRLSRSELIDDLYMSNSSVYRILKTMDERLHEKYNIGISSNPVQFEGREVDIRFFIAQYLSEKYSFNDWPYKEINEEKWSEFLKFFVDFASIQTDFTRMNYLKVLTLVSLIRYKNGFSIIGELDYEVDELWEKLEKDPIYQKKKIALEHIAGTKITKELIINLFYPYLQNGFAFSYQHLLDLSKDDLQINRSVLAIEKMLFQLSEEFHLTIPNKFDLTLELHNMYYLQNMEIDSSYILFNKKKFFCKTIEQKFPAIVQAMKREIDIWLGTFKEPITSSFKGHLLYTLFTYWESLVTQLLNQEGPTSILIITKFDIWQANMLSDFLKYYFGNQVEIFIYNQLTIDVDALKASNYDIILSTFQMNGIEDKSIYNISNVPTHQNIEKIQSMIHRLKAVPQETIFNLDDFS